MKTRATRLFYGGLAACFCLVFFAFAARCQPTFGGITANSGVYLSAGTAMDSFDSADPNHSIWQTGMTWHGTPYGVYSDNLSYNSNALPSRTSDFTVAADGYISASGSVAIYGFVNVAPGGFASVGGASSVGDLNWVYDGTPGIEPGHSERDMNAVFYSKSLPGPITGSQNNWWPVPAPPGGSTNIGGVVYSLLITNQPANSNFVYYTINELTQSLFIDASNVVLYLTNGMNYNGLRWLTINSNANVSIYSSGNITMSGNISNVTEYALALSIYDVAGYTNLAFSFAGNVGPALIYAPGTSMTFPGSATFIGAIFCENLNASGDARFHYDEAIGSAFLPIPPWIIQQPTNQVVQLGSNATFSVEAGSTAGPYQWFFGQGGPGTPINGATNTSLTITNVQLSDAGDYYVTMSSAYGSAATTPAFLVVYTNAAATLSASFDIANGQFQLLVQNPSAVGGRMPYTLQASTNLTDWVPVLTSGTPFAYTETNAYPQRYYRAVFQQ